MSQRVTKFLRKRWALGGLAGIALLSAGLGVGTHHEAQPPQVVQASAAAAWRPPSTRTALLPFVRMAANVAYAAEPSEKAESPGVTQAVSPADPVVPDTTYLKPAHRYADTVAIATKPAVEAYHVQAGDTIWSISAQFQTDMNTLMTLNPDIEPDVLSPGTTLRVVSDFHGIAYRVQDGDTLQQISSAYLSPVDEILKINQLSDETAIKAGELLFLPGGRPRNMVASRGARDRRPGPDAPVTPPTPAPVDAPAPRTGFIWPLSGGIISSEYGWRADIGDFHTGIDIAVPYGTPAGAAAAGTVTFAGWDGNYGNCVVIDHGGGIETKYGHGSSILVTVGQHVAQGQFVIRVGHTGRATGDHLHLEFIVNDKTVNPRNYLPPR